MTRKGSDTMKEMPPKRMHCKWVFVFCRIGCTLIAAAGLLLLSCSGTSLNAQANGSQSRRQAPADLSAAEAVAVKVYQDVLPSVVTIYTEKMVVSKDEQAAQRGLGSGVVISADGHILTAAHVVDRAERIGVKTTDGRTRPAVMLFSEASADIALLQLAKPAPDMPHARIGNSDRLAVGQRVFAVGSPYGLENSFSVGHISGFREFNRLYDGTIKAEFIQTDAAINMGNSGGPLFNSRGEVVGIASAIITQSGGFQGLGLVVTINTAKQLLALEDRVWLGIEGVFLDRTTLLRLMNQDLPGGLLVERVTRGGPAARAGLQGGEFPGRFMGRDFLFGGDLILDFNTEEVCTEACLLEARRNFQGKDKIPIKYLRSGKIHTTVIDITDSRRNYLK